MNRTISIEQFKKECLALLTQVHANQETILITKRNKPIVKLVPITENETPLFGMMKGTVHILDDLIEPIEEHWNANS